VLLRIWLVDSSIIFNRITKLWRNRESFDKEYAEIDASVRNTENDNIYLELFGDGNSSSETKSSNIRNERRVLLGNFFSDPKSIETKANTLIHPSRQNSLKLESLQTVTTTTPLKVLALGGSVTWGSCLKDRFRSAYPYLLSSDPNTVDNKAIRATGAKYSSLCIESMIDSDVKSYDVILFEFHLNGEKGLGLLMERLRGRFPSAIFIVVKLYSSQTLMHCNGVPLWRTNGSADCNWQWSYDVKTAMAERDMQTARHNAFISTASSKRQLLKLNDSRTDPAVLEQMIKNVNAYIYNLPFPFETGRELIDTGWYTNDYLHLTELGHATIARGLLNMLSSIDSIKTQSISPLRLGTPAPNYYSTEKLGAWGAGDQCYNWFASGDPTGVVYTGAEVRPLHPGLVVNTKNVMDVNEGLMGATLTIMSRYEDPAPLYIIYLGSNKRDYKFSIVQITLNMNIKHSKQLDPNGYDETVLGNTESHFDFVGWVKQGANTISVRSISPGTEKFMILGLAVCSYCRNFEKQL